MDIPLLDKNHYRGYLEPLGSPGIEYSFVGRVTLEDDSTENFYIKIYPESTKGLINEIIGALLADALNLSTPKAIVLLVPVKSLPSPPPWLTEYQGDQIPTWCTTDLAKPSLKMYYNLDRLRSVFSLRPVMRELLRSDQTPGVVAFDDWVANIDRNLGNLLRLSRQKYAFIDHGAILTGKMWAKKDLVASKDYNNTIRNLLRDVTYKPDFQSKAAFAANRHNLALQRTKKHLLSWSRQLLTNAEVSTVEDFLETRSDITEIPARYGRLAP